MAEEIKPDFPGNNTQKSFEEVLFRFRYPLLLLILGVLILGAGIYFFAGEKGWSNGGGEEEVLSDKIEVLESTTEGQEAKNIVVEISGAVETPGVYRVDNGSRIEDLLVMAGGFAADADRDWVEKYLNRAAKLTDGQKIFIPSFDKQTEGISAKKTGGYQNVSSSLTTAGESLVNINTSDQKTLESLPGIGPVYAQKIIEQRPYSNTADLQSKKIIPNATYEKIKDKITIY